MHSQRGVMAVEPQAKSSRKGTKSCLECESALVTRDSITTIDKLYRPTPQSPVRVALGRSGYVQKLCVQGPAMRAAGTYDASL
jgi:hypothetical protein